MVMLESNPTTSFLKPEVLFSLVCSHSKRCINPLANTTASSEHKDDRA